MAYANPPTLDQLITVLQQQQQLVQQLLANQLPQNAAPAAAPPTITIPSLPDVHPFEPTDDKSRISEWLARFKFALDCAAPNAIDATKVKCLMNKLSEAAFSEYSRSVLPSAVTDFNYDETILKMEKLFARPQSVFIDRYECLKAARHDGEDFRQFINCHRKLLKDFDFDSITKEQFQCLMLLTALRSSDDASLRQRILIKLAADKNGITYDSMVEDLINFQTTIAEAKSIERPSAFKNVSALKRGKEREQQQMPSNSRFANNSQNASTAQRKCWRCAGDHRADDCRHKLEKCPKCKFPGHIASQCESVQQWRRKFAKRPIQRKQIGSLIVGMAAKQINTTSLLKVGVFVNKKKTKFVADSGTEVNIIDEEAYDQIGRPKIQECAEKGQLFDGSKVAFIGKGVATFQFGEIAIDQEFYVAKRGSLNLLSISTMDAFGLLDDLKRKISNSAINLCANNNSSAPFTSEAAEKFIRKLKATFSTTFEEGLGLCTKELAHLS